MKKFFLIFMFIFSLAFALSCMQKQSALDKLLYGGQDPIEAMRLPDKPVTTALDVSSSQEEVQPIGPIKPKQKEMESATLDKISAIPAWKQVTVTKDNAPLRKGPGVNYSELGFVFKGNVFRFLKNVVGSDSTSAWYLIQDKDNRKYYISSQFASVNDKKEKTLVKTNLKQAQNNQSGIIRKVNNPGPPIPDELIKAKHITLNFEDTEIYDVITTFCQLLKMDYVIEGVVNGKVTLQTFNKIPSEDLYSVFEQVLAINNITVVRSGDFYRFLPIKDAVRKPLSLYYGSDLTIPAEDRLIMQIIPIRHVSSQSIKKVIQPMLSQKATLMNIPETNHIMLIELSSNVDKILRLVQILDLGKLADSEIQLFKIMDSDAEMIVEELNEIFISIGHGEAIGKSLSFLPIPRLNSILVVNSLDNVMPTVEFWIGKLDQPTAERRHSTFVYYVQNADAVKMTDVLNSIFKGQTLNNSALAGKLKPSSPNNSVKGKTKKGSVPPRPTIITRGGITDNVKGEITIIPDTDTNSVITRTDPRNYPAILELIKKLDLMPQQVLIEVLILDLTLDEQTQLGLDWAMQGSVGGTTLAGGTSTVVPSGGQSLGSMIGSAITPIFAPGASFFVQDPGRIIALLQAFASDSKVNVLANPILVTSDNREANISISDDIPIESTVLVTNTTEPVTSTTVEFRNVGIKLAILPKINSDNYVNLKIQQEISSIGPIIGSTPSFSVRTVNTEVVLKDNQVLVMGGLMRTDTSETSDGVPGLKDIPYLGKFFSTNSVTSTKTELMLFITPHIMSKDSDANFITNQLKNRLESLKKPEQRKNVLSR